MGSRSRRLFRNGAVSVAPSPDLASAPIGFRTKTHGILHGCRAADRLGRTRGGLTCLLRADNTLAAGLFAQNAKTQSKFKRRQEFEWVHPAACPVHALRAFQRNQSYPKLGDRCSARPHALRTTSRHQRTARRSQCARHRDASVERALAMRARQQLARIDIEHVAMDAFVPYIHAVDEALPEAAWTIVFDKLHITWNPRDAVNAVRVAERRAPDAMQRHDALGEALAVVLRASIEHMA